MRPLPPKQDIGHVMLKPRSDKAPRAGEAPSRERVAVVVAHGVGQQVPFETMDLAVQGLQREAILRKEKVARPGVGIVKEGDETLQYASVVAGAREVHVYEAYWAPLTEGKTGARDVLAFLVRGGFNGLRNARRPFSRWMFGKTRSFGRRPGTTGALVGAAAFLAGLVALNVIVALAAAGTLSGVGGPATMPALTWVLLAYLAFAALAGAAIGWASRANRRFTTERADVAARRLDHEDTEPTPKEDAILHARSPAAAAARRASAIAAPLLWTALALTPLAALVMGALIMWPGIWPTPPALPSWVVTALWGALLLASVGARGLFVQYVGDIAAYVSSHKLDKYADLREAIKKRACKTTRAVYAMRRDDDPTKPLYDRVVLVGHSLGSVVVYDTYNALVNEDLLADPKASLDVARRTPLLLTFGSPLDKTAFVFGTTRDHTSETREALAAVKQPLILDAKHRPRAWVNVYARRDIISGELTFYSPPSDDNKDVPEVVLHNVEDDEATTPLLAHNEFWRTRRVWRTLRDAIDGEPARSIRVHAGATSARGEPDVVRAR